MWFTNPAATAGALAVTLHLSGAIAVKPSVFVWGNWATEPTIALSNSDSLTFTTVQIGVNTYYSKTFTNIPSGSLVTAFTVGNDPKNTLYPDANNPLTVYDSQTDPSATGRIVGSWTFYTNGSPSQRYSFIGGQNHSVVNLQYIIGVFSATGVIPPSGSNNFAQGGCTASGTDQLIATNTTLFYVFKSGAAGVSASQLDVFVSKTIISGSSDPNIKVALELFEVTAGGGNTNPININNPLVLQTFKVFTLPATHTFSPPTDLNFNFNLFPILPNTWYAFAFVAQHHGVYIELATTDITVYEVSLPNPSPPNWGSGGPITGFSTASPTIEICGTVAQPSVTVNVTNQVITTTTTNVLTTSTTTVTSTTLATNTITQEVNVPDISSINFWLFPLILVFVPFLFVIGAIAFSQRALNEDVLVPIGLITLTVTSWMGYAWNGFVPIYFGVTFAMMSIVYFWRR
jgi:hypothetical protein